MFETEDIVFLVTNALIFLFTLYTIYLVTIRRIVRVKKYTRWMTIILLLSIVHSICTGIHYIQIQLEKNASMVRGLMQQVSSLMLCTISISQAELLNYFSVIAPFWTAKRVSMLQVVFIALQLLPQLPLIIQWILERVQNQQAHYMEQVVYIDIVEDMGIHSVCGWSLSLCILGHSLSPSKSLPLFPRNTTNDAT
jgi:hypothetical protein